MKKRYGREILGQLQLNSFRGKAKENASVVFYWKLISHYRLEEELPAIINASDFKYMRSIKPFLWKIRHYMFYQTGLGWKASNAFVKCLDYRHTTPNRPILGSKSVQLSK